MIKGHILLTILLLGGSLEVLAVRGGGAGGFRGGGGGRSLSSPGRGGLPGGRSIGASRPASFARPSSGFQAGQGQGFRPIGRPQGTRGPTAQRTLPGYRGRQGAAEGRFAGRAGADRVGGRFNLSRPRTFDSHRTEQSVSKQRNFMNRRVGGHNWQWLAANNFPLFISTFPFAYYADNGDYPPIYYDYYDEYGTYPTQSNEYDMMMSEQGPAVPPGEPTQEDIMNCQADCSPQCMGDCRAQGELTDSECMQQCKQICVDSCRPQ